MNFEEARLWTALRRVFGEIPTYQRRILAAEASTRLYHRLTFPGRRDERSLIAMDLPPDFLGSDEASSGGRPRKLPFLEVQRIFEDRGLPVPKVRAVDLDSRIILLEDLGDRTFESLVIGEGAQSLERHYERAVDLMVRMHTALHPPPARSIVEARRFDRELLRWELDHFREWGIEALSGPLPAAKREALSACFERIVDVLAEAPLGFVHRDFQSRNLMVREDGTLAIIDFQDAMVGPVIYDLVALLCDSYVELDVSLRRRLIARYAAARRLDPGAMEHLFDLQTVQRKLKDAGRFVFIDRVRGNSRFLRHYPSSLARVGEALDALPGEHQLSQLLRELVPGFPFACEVPRSISAEGAETKTSG